MGARRTSPPAGHRGLPAAGRRAVLLGAAGLLAGCETLDNLFGETKTPLPGSRRPVLAAGAGGPAADPGLRGRAVALPAAVPRADWPQAGGGVAHAPGHVALGPRLVELWRASVGDGGSYRRRLTGAPVVAGGAVYAADAFGVVSAFDAATGARRWRRDTRPERERDGAVGAGLAVEGATLYAATGLSELLAIEPGNGAVRWRAALPAPARGGLAVAGGRVHVPTIEGQLVTLSAEDGRGLWVHRAQVVPAVPLGLPAPAVEGETVVAGFASGELVALRATDGRVAWSETLAAAGRTGLSEINGIRALPVIERGRAFAVGMGGLTLAVDVRSGRRVWEREFGGTEAPAAAGDWLFLVTDAAEALAVGRDDGRVRWVSPLRPPATGRRPDASIYGAPVLAGGRLLVPGSAGELLSLDPATGVVGARLRLPGPAALQPAVAEGRLFVLTDDGTLVAYRGEA